MVAEPRYADIKAEDIKFENKAEEIDSSIELIHGLLMYHRRMCTVADPNFMASCYERGLMTALKCLEEARSALS